MSDMNILHTTSHHLLMRHVFTSQEGDRIATTVVADGVWDLVTVSAGDKLRVIRRGDRARV